MAYAIITSAAYIDGELKAEFGALPPSFLPFGNLRLYQEQFNVLKTFDSDIYLTLPESFTPDQSDLKILASLNIITISIPDDLSLGESILYGLNMISRSGETVHLLHGDTLVYDIPSNSTDIIALSRPPAAYNWGALSHSSLKLLNGLDEYNDNSIEEDSVLAGYFSFSDESFLRYCLTKSRGDFLQALKLYNKKKFKGWVTKKWLDFGHLQTFYRSRCKAQIQRHFNNITLDFAKVHKSSNDKKKIQAEVEWYEAIPSELRQFTPAFLGISQKKEINCGYEIEYLPVPSLYEIFVFGKLSTNVWTHIFDSIQHFLETCLNYNSEALNQIGTENVIGKLTYEKTLNRMTSCAPDLKKLLHTEWRYRGERLPSIAQIADDVTTNIDFSDTNFLGVQHGDLCLTNMFYDFRTHKIKVIDPRGKIPGCKNSIWGDLRYDMAKITHSLIGRYEYILSGRYNCKGFDSGDLTIDFPYDSTSVNSGHLIDSFSLNGLKLDSDQILSITIHLFISMLPLHKDRPDRQRAFIANVLRLFSKLERS